MRTIETKVYSFNELNEDAKQKAIEQVRNDEYRLCYDWYEFTYEYFKENQNYFDIDKIYFSGFWSQGDGAMFEYSRLNESLKEEFIDSLPLSNMRKNWLRNNVSISGKGSHSGHYYHEGCCYHAIYWEVDNLDISWSSNLGKFIESYSIDFEDFVISKYKDLCRDLYRELEKESDFLNSDEAIINDIEANDIEFLEDGTKF